MDNRPAPNRSAQWGQPCKQGSTVPHTGTDALRLPNSRFIKNPKNRLRHIQERMAQQIKQAENLLLSDIGFDSHNVSQ